jgi:hypothetical protein
MSLVPGRCPVGFDSLTPPDLRILEVRSLLIRFEGMGLGETISREYGLTAEDMRILAHMDAVLRAAKEKDET